MSPNISWPPGWSPPSCNRQWWFGSVLVCVCVIVVEYFSAEPGICCGNKDSRGIENRKSQKNTFSVEKRSTSILFYSMKIKRMDLWMQIEDTKLILVMNFRVLDFFKFASRMTQIAQILVSTFKIFQGGMKGRGKGLPPDPPRNLFNFFFISNSRFCFWQVS